MKPRTQKLILVTLVIAALYSSTYSKEYVMKKRQSKPSAVAKTPIPKGEKHE